MQISDRLAEGPFAVVNMQELFRFLPSLRERVDVSRSTKRKQQEDNSILVQHVDSSLHGKSNAR